MLTDEQIKDAIRQIKVQCDLSMPTYDPISARGTLHTLGYVGEEVEEVLDYLYASGFTYCLDPKYPTGDGEHVPYSACVWGPDQLKSRLPYVG